MPSNDRRQQAVAALPMPLPPAELAVASQGKYMPVDMVRVCAGMSAARVLGLRSMRGRYSTFLDCRMAFGDWSLCGSSCPPR